MYLPLLRTFRESLFISTFHMIKNLWNLTSSERKLPFQKQACHSLATIVGINCLKLYERFLFSCLILFLCVNAKRKKGWPITKNIVFFIHCVTDFFFYQILQNHTVKLCKRCYYNITQHEDSCFIPIFAIHTNISNF